jgi:transposase
VHASLFRYLGGVPKFVVCDNLKAAVTNPDRYDPGINSTYGEMAGHYGTAILAWRPGRGGQRTRPRLRNCSPRSITPGWENCRTSPTSLRAGSVAASPLTTTSRSTPIGIPPPNRLIRELVDVRIADKTVEVFRRGQRIASHARAPNRRGHTTIADQMPSAHRRYGKWTPGGLIAAGEKIGPPTAAFFQVVIEARPHPEQGFRTCLDPVAGQELRQCANAGLPTRQPDQGSLVASIRSILTSGLDRAFLGETSDHQPLRHGNVRGQGYFH